MADALAPAAADALEAWRRRVRANREQAERLREGAPPRDFYAAVASDFQADPRRADEPVLEVLRALVEPGETWLDIGAGGGRYALPLALHAGRVIAIDPSPGMLGVLRNGMATHGIANIEVVEARWPMAEAPSADVALIAHLGYDVEDIGSFLEAMERAARRLCVAVLVTPSPPYLAEPFWPPVHAEPRVRLPSLTEFLVVLLARGRLFDIRLLPREPLAHATPEGPMPWLYQQLFVGPDTAKGQRLARLARDAMQERSGRWALSWERGWVGVVTWRPRGPSPDAHSVDPRRSGSI
jgi:SAM-dependent methyltransferase